MPGRIYEEVGAPRSESDPALIAKRVAFREQKRRKSNDNGYVAYPPPYLPGIEDAARRYVRRRAEETGAADAGLLLTMLGLV